MADPGSGDRGDYTLVLPTTKTEPHSSALEYEHHGLKRRAFWHRFGSIHLLILFVGLAIPLAALTVLGLLWKESMIATTSAEARTPWVRIFSANWATSVVTICSAFITTSMTFQASLLTAMFAGIILEKIGVPLFQAPLYSVMRALQGAPNNLLSTSMFRPRGLFATFIYILVVLEVLLTIASQFLSTIFVSDFEVGTFANMGNTTSVRTWEDPQTRTSQKWWTVPPASSWTFAEHSESATDGPGFRDTGHTYRAFLPFEVEAERTMLRDFRGPALVMDQRVICATPSLTDLSFQIDGGVIYLSGRAEMDSRHYPTVEEAVASSSVEFTCELPHAEPSTNLTEMGESSLCFPTRGAGKILLEDPLIGADRAGSTIFDPSRLSNSAISTSFTFMVLDMISPESIRYNAFDSKQELGADKNDGAWAVVTNGTATSNRTTTEALKLTTCITNLVALTFMVDMHGSRERVEPRIPWDAQANGYDAEAVLRQLGASSSPRNPGDRGILELAPRSEWQDGDFVNSSLPFAGFFAQSLFNTISSVEGTEPVVFLSKRDSANKNHAHATHATVFQDTLRGTGNPALAAQAVMARIHQMAYYDQLPQQSTRADASTSFSTSALIPVRWRGFIAATALIVTHFIILAVVTILFVGFTAHSLLGNHWQAISQIVSEDTRPMLEQADRAEDKQVERWAESQSIDVKNHVVLQHRGDGRVTLSAKGLSPRSRLKEEGKLSPARTQLKDAHTVGAVSDNTGVGGVQRDISREGHPM